MRIAIDSALLVGFVVAFATRERTFDPDYVLHGTVGLASTAVIGLHLWANRAWITRLAARGRRDPQARLALLNLAFAVVSAVCIASGIPLWTAWIASGWMIALHAGTGFGAIVLMIVHLAWNQRRIRTLVRRRPRPLGPSATPEPGRGGIDDGVFTVDAGIDGSFTLPNAPYGTYACAGVDPASGAPSAPVQAQVDQPSPAPLRMPIAGAAPTTVPVQVLPRTGTDPSSPLRVAWCLAVAGLALQWVVRARPRPRPLPIRVLAKRRRTTGAAER